MDVPHTPQGHVHCRRPQGSAPRATLGVRNLDAAPRHGGSCLEPWVAQPRITHPRPQHKAQSCKYATVCQRAGGSGEAAAPPWRRPNPCLHQRHTNRLETYPRVMTGTVDGKTIHNNTLESVWMGWSLLLKVLGSGREAASAGCNFGVARMMQGCDKNACILLPPQWRGRFASEPL